MNTRFFALEAHNASRELPVNVERLFARDWVSSDDGMDSFHWIPPDGAPSFTRARKVGLLDAGMYGLEGAQERDELGGKLLQGLNLRRKQCIASGLGLGEKEERGEARWLQFVRDIGVPDGRSDAIIDLEVEGRV